MLGSVLRSRWLRLLPLAVLPLLGALFAPGEHHAGPVAFISTPDPTTGLGPLCLNPDPSAPGGCHP